LRFCGLFLQCCSVFPRPVALVSRSICAIFAVNIRDSTVSIRDSTVGFRDFAVGFRALVKWPPAPRVLPRVLLNFFANSTFSPTELFRSFLLSLFKSRGFKTQSAITLMDLLINSFADEFAD
jgi:hypothetical protein